jgi:hypothetical protein
MPTETYIPLANLTLSSGQTSVTFSSISQAYRDLVLVINWQNSGLGSAGRLEINSNTGSNYNGVWMTGWTPSNVSSSYETNNTSARIAGASYGPLDTYSNIATLFFMDYTATDKHKLVISRYGAAAAGESQATFSRFASTSAITTIKFFDVVGQTFTTGSTFTLYGIAA